MREKREGGRAGGRRDGKGTHQKGREGNGWDGRRSEGARREALVSHAFVRMVLPVCEVVRGHEQAVPRAWCVRTCVREEEQWGWAGTARATGQANDVGSACLSLRYTSATLGSAT